MVWGIGLNYREHAQEAAGVGDYTGDAPADPVFFTKAPTTVNGPYGQIVIECAVSTKIDWEVELGVVIGRALSGADESEARRGIAGGRRCGLGPDAVPYCAIQPPSTEIAVPVIWSAAAKHRKATVPPRFT